MLIVAAAQAGQAAVVGGGEAELNVLGFRFQKRSEIPVIFFRPGSKLFEM
jgi:hypothetical protein